MKESHSSAKSVPSPYFPAVAFFYPQMPRKDVSIRSSVQSYRFLIDLGPPQYSPAIASNPVGIRASISDLSATNIYYIQYIVGSFACIGGALFGMDISSMSAVLNVNILSWSQDFVFEVFPNPIESRIYGRLWSSQLECSGRHCRGDASRIICWCSSRHLSGRRNW